MAQADFLFWIYLFAMFQLVAVGAIFVLGTCPFPRECPSTTSEGEGSQQMQEIATPGKGGARGQKTSG